MKLRSVRGVVRIVFKGSPSPGCWGLGRALMNAAIELARREGADYMDLG